MQEMRMKEKKNTKEWLSLGLLLFSILATLVTTGIRYDDVYLPFADMKDVQVIDEDDKSRN